LRAAKSNRAAWASQGLISCSRDTDAINLSNSDCYSALNFSLKVFLMVALFCAFTQPAYAYADPGSGLLAIQIIGSTFAGLIFLIRVRLRRLFVTTHYRVKNEDVAQK
jgi:hypothetical protein